MRTVTDNSMPTVTDKMSDGFVARSRLLQRRMVAAGLAVEAIARSEPDIFRGLQKRCAICEYSDLCDSDLRDISAAPGPKAYCPNVVLLNALSEMWWFRAYV